MERHNWASGSHDCGRADQICTHPGGTLTRQSAALQLGGTVRSSTPGSITQGEGSDGPGMAYDELLAGRVRDCLREVAGVGMNHG